MISKTNVAIFGQWLDCDINSGLGLMVQGFLCARLVLVEGKVLTYQYS